MRCNSKILSMVCLSLGSCERVIRSDYFFPKDFSGEVAVIYNCKDSKPPIYKGDRLQLFIPASGILKVGTPLMTGTADTRFFIRNDSGSYDTIYRHLDKENIEVSKKYIFFERVMFDSCIENKKTFTAVFFNVGVSLDVDSVRTPFEQHVFNLLCPG